MTKTKSAKLSRWNSIGTAPAGVLLLRRRPQVRHKRESIGDPLEPDLRLPPQGQHAAGSHTDRFPLALD